MASRSDERASLGDRMPAPAAGMSSGAVDSPVIEKRKAVIKWGPFLAAAVLSFASPLLGQTTKPVDAARERASYLIDFYKTIGTDAKLKKAFEEEGNSVVGSLLSGDEYGLAIKLADLVKRAAVARDSNAETGWNHRITEMRQIQIEYDKVKDSISALAKDGNDSTASFAVGKFLCYVKNDWKAGLSLFVNGGETVTKMLAQTELGKPKAQELLSVADRWW